MHHAGIRIATGAFRSSPIQSLLVDAGILPLELIRQSQIIKYWVRAQRIPGSLLYLVIFNENNPLLFENKPLYPKPFSVRVRIILEELEISKGKSPSSKILCISAVEAAFCGVLQLPYWL